MFISKQANGKITPEIDNGRRKGSSKDAWTPTKLFSFSSSSIGTVEGDFKSDVCSFKFRLQFCVV